MRKPCSERTVRRYSAKVQDQLGPLNEQDILRVLDNFCNREGVSPETENTRQLASIGSSTVQMIQSLKGSDKGGNMSQQQRNALTILKQAACTPTDAHPLSQTKRAALLGLNVPTAYNAAKEGMKALNDFKEGVTNYPLIGIIQPRQSPTAVSQQEAQAMVHFWEGVGKPSPQLRDQRKFNIKG